MMTTTKMKTTLRENAAEVVRTSVKTELTTNTNIITIITTTIIVVVTR